MSSETKAAFENMQFYKFYPVPTSDSPDVSSVKVSSLSKLANKQFILGLLIFVKCAA